MEQTPFMKAMYAFARADPDDCLREWAVVLALVSNDETASDSSPKNSTSSLAPAAATKASPTTSASARPHIPRNAAPISNPTTPAVSRAVLNAEHDSPKDDLSPGARRIYDYIVSNSAKPPTTDVCTNFWARTELDAVHDAVEVPAAPTPTTCSTICLRDYTSATSTPSSTLASSADTSATSSTVASSAPTTTSAVIVPAASMGPTAGVLLEDGDNLSSTPPLVCLIMWPSGGICTVASEPCSVKPNFVLGVSDFSLKPAAYLVDVVDITAASPTKLAISTPLHLSSPSPTSTTAALLSADGFTMQMLMCALSLATEIKRPWPPPCYVRCQEGNMYKDMLQSLLLDGFVLQSMQLMLWAGKYRWPPPTPNRSKACRISNLESTMEIEWNTTLSMCTSTLGVQRAQQQPTMFKWSDLVCHDTYWLTANTRVDRRLELLLARRATCTLWTWYYLHNLHCSPGSNNFAITDWALSILSLETWLLLNGDSASVKIQRSITVQQSTRSSGFFASLEGVELKLWPALLVSIFVPSVQSAQLQPTVFRWPVAFSNMTLAVASIVASLRDTSLMTELATPNGSCDYLEPVLRFIINLFSWSPHSKWPPISPNGPFLISADVHQEFMGIYSVTAVLPRLFILVVMRTEEMLWPIFQFATGNMILLLPWDPGLPLSGLAMIMFSTPVYGLAVRLRSSTEVTCLQGNSTHELFSCSFVVELIKNGMVASTSCNLRLPRSVIFLQPKPPWSYFCPAISICVGESLHTSSHDEFYSSNMIVKSHDLLEGIYSKCSISTIFHAEKFCLLLGQFSSCDQFVPGSATDLGSQLFEWQNPCWDITNTIDSIPAIKHLSDWVLFFLAASNIQCGSQLIPWEIANSKDGLLTYTKRVLISWDPGGSVPVFSAATDVNWNSTKSPFLHLTWDPGGYMQHRLEGKPKFKEGGLSATPSVLGLAWTWAAICWALACPKATEATEEATTNMKGTATTKSAKNETERAASAEARVARVACCVVLLLPPRSIFFLMFL